MAGVTIMWIKGSPAQFVGMGERIVDQLYSKLADEMVGIAARAAANARAYTDRVDTGEMLRSISHEVEQRANSIVGAFGFTGDVKAYFVYQTVTGFTHWLSGEYIEPTFALRDARIRATPEVLAAIRRAIRSVKVP